MAVDTVGKAAGDFAHGRLLPPPARSTSREPRRARPPAGPPRGGWDGRRRRSRRGDSPADRSHRHFCSGSTSTRRRSRPRLRGSLPAADASSWNGRRFENFGPCSRSTVGRRLDAVLLDLGVSSRQLDAPERGFRFSEETADVTPLDMRMDQTLPATAADLLSTATAQPRSNAGCASTASCPARIDSRSRSTRRDALHRSAPCATCCASSSEPGWAADAVTILRRWCSRRCASR